MPTSSERRASGGPVLQDAVTDAIMTAMFEELAAVGYGKLSVEAVAKRAGAGKAAIYRRWPSKQAMVIELVTQVAIRTADDPDTGSLRGDLRAFLAAAEAGLRHPLASRIIPDLFAESGRTPELAEAMRPRISQVRREQAGALLQRAVERGELSADLNVPLALDFLVGPLYWRLTVLAAPTDPDYLDQLTDMLLTAFGAGAA
ncbi:TetR-like C-terminal domain-containing protein [Streptomyces sp. NPDC088725]|uniref:TetR-like C-terminal domain-containing protein n=1 Tax=Streptomyces sp. NPDC088725 TaxID=3365873 RepID=UPI00382EA026